MPFSVPSFQSNEPMKKFKSVDDYFSQLPQKIKPALSNLRKIIQESAPEAEEVISYNMPAFKLHGMLVWYAAWKEHIGFYPTPSALDVFKKELLAYKGAKGSVQFPIDKPLPLNLVTKIVK